MNKKESVPLKTVFIITLGFLIVFLITGHRWTIFVSLLVGVAGVFSNYIAVKIDFIWMKISWMLGLIVPNILMSIIFFFILFPIAFLARVLGEKDPLNLKNNSDTLFKTKKKQFDKNTLKNTW